MEMAGILLSCGGNTNDGALYSEIHCQRMASDSVEISVAISCSREAMKCGGAGLP